MAGDLSRRPVWLFVADSWGRRPIYGAREIVQNHPDWTDLLIFPEYLHGDNGAGLGAWDQTGRTALIVDLVRTLPGSP